MKHIPIHQIPSIKQQVKSCATCGGECCKGIPGVLSVEQVTVLAGESDFMTAVDKLITSGKWAFTHRYYNSPTDSCEERVYVIAAKGVSNMVSFGRDNVGRCINLTASGCSLGSKKPFECVEVIPLHKVGEEKNCRAIDSEKLEKAWMAWEQYQDKIYDYIYQ